MNADEWEAPSPAWMNTMASQRTTPMLTIDKLIPKRKGKKRKKKAGEILSLIYKPNSVLQSNC